LRRVRDFLVVLLAALLAGPAGAGPHGPFGNWAVIVVAGDDHAAHTDNLTETFDDARRDVAAALVGKGFSPGNILQFSVRPGRYRDTGPAMAQFEIIAEGLRALTRQAPDGCLIYFSSHGSPDGVVVDDELVPPRVLKRLVDRQCGTRPTVVVMSACFSGVFVPALEGPDRLILTAARRDRSSFGCSESDKYPFFDACMLQVLPGARDFLALAPALRACVAERERDEDASPPSRPQASVGKTFARTTPAFE